MSSTPPATMTRLEAAAAAKSAAEDNFLQALRFLDAAKLQKERAEAEWNAAMSSTQRRLEMNGMSGTQVEPMDFLANARRVWSGEQQEQSQRSAVASSSSSSSSTAGYPAPYGNYHYSNGYDYSRMPATYQGNSRTMDTDMAMESAPNDFQQRFNALYYQYQSGQMNEAGPSNSLNALSSSSYASASTATAFAPRLPPPPAVGSRPQSQPQPQPLPNLASPSAPLPATDNSTAISHHNRKANRKVIQDGTARCIYCNLQTQCLPRFITARTSDKSLIFEDTGELLGSAAPKLEDCAMQVHLFAVHNEGMLERTADGTVNTEVWVCPFCNKQFRCNESNFKEHLMKDGHVHGWTGFKHFRCGSCANHGGADEATKDFSSRRTIHTHLREIHLGEFDNWRERRKTGRGGKVLLNKVEGAPARTDDRYQH